jgi:3-isopropylmalate dehydrogenase
MYRIAVIPGDGIGPEVVREGVRVLDEAAQLLGFQCEKIGYPHGANHFSKTGELLPDAIISELKQMDAILFGAIGDPRVEPGLLEREVFGKIRSKLDLYVNLRPIKLYSAHLTPLKDKGPEDIDFLVVRENTEDIRAGVGGFLKKGTQDEVAVQEMMYTWKGTERVVRYAFEQARKRRKHLTLVDKANAIHAHDLWRRVSREVSRAFPDVETDAIYVDAAAVCMLEKPEQFDVMVTTGMFGHIIADVGAILQGGMGIAAGGSIHPGRASMFEPIHGSVPKYAGKNVACPVAAIAAAGMLLDHIGERRAARLVEMAIESILVEKKIASLSTDSGLSTEQVGSMMLEQMKRLEKDLVS